ncbi:hypothetical protein HPB47_010868 [Ixodes persulcatus]|uniref:Uncharacterized protein n=1 Tax=Ixodes persulcatus TaxID=34615 RepID=A0AC60NY18_IXOPE|nr:hypothetical protein HPB47_010868 [Ixodes persulcatus]
MSQDPVERFFGKVRQVGCQNDHPNMPTFPQSIQESEPPILSFAGFKAVYQDDEPRPAQPIVELRQCLHGEISTSKRPSRS